MWPLTLNDKKYAICNYFQFYAIIQQYFNNLHANFHSGISEIMST